MFKIFIYKILHSLPSLLFVVLIGLVGLYGVLYPLSQKKIKAALNERQDNIVFPVSLIAGEECLKSQNLVLEYYKRNGNNPVWIGSNGLSPLGDTLLSVINKSYEEGLDSMQYHITAIKTLCKEAYKQGHFGEINSDNVLLDMLLTDAFFTYAEQQYAGIIHTVNYNMEWGEHVKSVSLIDSLQKAVASKQIKGMLYGFTCKEPGYLSLRKGLHRYIEIKRNGGWPIIPEDTHLEKGDKGRLVSLLLKHLTITGDISNNHDNDTVYGDALEEAVKRYEQRHGLTDDGVVSRQVVKELNKDIDDRLGEIKLNMERWRWLPHNMQQPYILVNIAGFNLAVVDSNKQMIRMKIVAGKTYKQTPVFKSKVTYIVLNPWWEIPPGIAEKEMLPLAKRDKNYFTKNNIKVYAGWQTKKEVSPVSVNWDSVSASNFTYHFRQMPGSHNALGRIVFMFPNKYNVYLHDTPNKHLFSEPVRAFSHGCIRIEKPLELAEFLLRNNTDWTEDRLVKVISSDKQAVTIILNTPVDIYINYWTAWANDSGQVSFVPDIYNYYKQLNNDLRNHTQSVKNGMPAIKFPFSY